MIAIAKETLYLDREGNLTIDEGAAVSLVCRAGCGVKPETVLKYDLESRWADKPELEPESGGDDEGGKSLSAVDSPDYAELSKKQLQAKCDERELEYEHRWNKKRLRDLLIADDGDAGE